MNQGIMENFRKKYQCHLLEHSAQSDDKIIESRLKSVNMRNTVYWIADSCKEIEFKTLNKSCLKFLPKLASSIKNLNHGNGETLFSKIW